MNYSKSISMGRRWFIGLITSTSTGLLLYRPGWVNASKSSLKTVLGHIEVDVLRKSKPRKLAEMATRRSGEAVTFFKKESARPLFEVNRTGKTIWEGCDGKNTPLDIAKIVSRTYQVDGHQAYVDCLFFLSVLNAKGAIQL